MERKTLVSASKLSFLTDNIAPTEKEIKVGALQRIATSVEVIAKNYQSLIDDKNYFEKRATELFSQTLKLEKRISALKGVITKLKKK